MTENKKMPANSAYLHDGLLFKASPVIFATAMNLYCWAVSLLICVELVEPLAAQVSASILVSVLNTIALTCYVRIITTSPGHVPEEWVVAQEHLLTDEAGNVTAIASDAPALQHPAYTTSLQSSGVYPSPSPQKRFARCKARYSFAAHWGLARVTMATSKKRWGNRAPAQDQHGARRFCPKCVVVKPDRASHCSMCKRCTLRFDHHCPWVANCIGHGNHKYFAVFLVWSVLTDICFFGLSLPYVIRYASGMLSNTALGPPLCVMFGIAAVMLPSIGGLCITHQLLMLRNKTTLQMHFPPLFSVPTARPNGFDLGVKENWKQMMGSSPWLWFVPVNDGSHGNGVHYPVCVKDAAEDV